MRKLLTFLSTCLIATQLVIPHAVSAQSNLSFQAKGSHKKHHCCKQGKRGKRGKQGLQGPAGAPGASTTNPSTTSFTYANLVYKGAEEVMPQTLQI